MLRVYEGCGRAYLGEVEGANVIKLHRFSSKLSYLVNPDFDADPPVLHRKETFLHPDHPLHARFARLTRQEEEHGLLADPATIGTRLGWQARLHAAGWVLRGHRLVRSPPA